MVSMIFMLNPTSEKTWIQLKSRRDEDVLTLKKNIIKKTDIFIRIFINLQKKIKRL